MFTLQKKLFAVVLLSVSIISAGCQASSTNTNGTAIAAEPKGKMEFLLLDPSNLSALKEKYKSNDPATVKLVDELKADADKALKGGMYSVMNKTSIPPSGNKHDYMSIGVYWWPDPSKPDGKPYIHKDGYVNPEVYDNTFDKASHVKMSADVQTLALAYYYTGNVEYAKRASKLVRAWFIDPETRMNPNLNYGQAVPGRNNGRPEGLIEFVDTPNLIDSIILLYNNSQEFTKDDMEKFTAWITEFHQWLMQSEIAKGEDHASNNHGDWFDVQAVAYEIFTGQKDLAISRINSITKARIESQIKSDGTLPLELARTRPLHYTMYAESALVTSAKLADKLGIDLWNYKTDDGHGIRLVLDYMTPYLDGSKTFGQKDVMEETEYTKFGTMLRCAASKYNDSRYANAANRFLEGSHSYIVELTFPNNI